MPSGYLPTIKREEPNLYITSVFYPMMGGLFLLSQPHPIQVALKSHQDFFWIALLSLTLTVLTHHSSYVARRSGRILVGIRYLCSFQLSFFAAREGLGPLHFAWSLLGPLDGCITLTPLRRLDVLMIFAWTTYGVNILAALHYGTGTAAYFLSHVFVLLTLVPLPSNLVRMARQAREQRKRVVLAAAALQG